MLHPWLTSPPPGIGATASTLHVVPVTAPLPPHGAGFVNPAYVVTVVFGITLDAPCAIGASEVVSVQPSVASLPVSQGFDVSS
jgi:hypothetical protein